MLSFLKRKKTLVVLFLFCILLVFVFIIKLQFSTKTIRFVAPHGPYQIVLEPLQQFKHDVESHTKGRIKVEIIIPEDIDNFHLTKVKETFDAVQNGTFEMTQIYTAYLSKFDKDFSALETPYLFKNLDDCFSFADSEIGKNLLNRLENKSPLKSLGLSCADGYRIINTKNKKITRLSEFKGLKLATGTPVNTSILKTIGVNAATKLQKSEIRKQIANNQLDGLVSVYPRLLLNEEYKIASVVNELFFNMQTSASIINKKFFYSLSTEEQRIVALAMKKASALERRLALELVEDFRKNASRYGVQIINLSARDKKLLIKNLTAINWEKELNLTPDIVQKIRNSMKFNAAAND